MHSKGGVIEVITIKDLYKRSEYKDKETGEILDRYTLLKKDSRKRISVKINTIVSIEEEYNKAGSVYKNRFKMNLDGNQEPLVVLGKYNDYKGKVFSQNNSIGFKFYDK